jgi:hypothetical protein
VEASVAQNGGQGDAAGAAAEQQSAPQVDLSPVLERLEGLDGRLGRVEPALAALAPEEPGEQNPLAELEALFAPDEPDPADQAALDGRALLQGLQAMQQQTSSATEQQVQEALAPVMQQLSSLQVRLDAEALTQKHPDLEKPEVFQPVVENARELATRLGQPELSTSAQFIELVYLSELAKKVAAGEVPAGQGREFALENGAGGAPAGDEPDIARGIVNSRGGNAFWGT